MAILSHVFGLYLKLNAPTSLTQGGFSFTPAPLLPRTLTLAKIRAGK